MAESVQYVVCCEICRTNIKKELEVTRDNPPEGAHDYEKVLSTSCCKKLAHVQCANRWLKRQYEIWLEGQEDGGQPRMRLIVCGLCKTNKVKLQQMFPNPEDSEDTTTNMTYTKIYNGVEVRLTDFEPCPTCTEEEKPAVQENKLLKAKIQQLEEESKKLKKRCRVDGKQLKEVLDNMDSQIRQEKEKAAAEAAALHSQEYTKVSVAFTEQLFLVREEKEKTAAVQEQLNVARATIDMLRKGAIK